MTKSKRFWLTVVAFIAECALAYHGMNKGTDLISLGTLIVMINSGTVGYMLFETKRPSGAAASGKQPE